jgi:hypothetical protein
VFLLFDIYMNNICLHTFAKQGGSFYDAHSFQGLRSIGTMSSGGWHSAASEDSLNVPRAGSNNEFDSNFSGAPAAASIDHHNSCSKFFFVDLGH